MILTSVTTNTNNNPQGLNSAYFLLIFIALILVLRIKRIGRNRSISPQRMAVIIVLYSILAYITLIGAPTLGGYLYYILVLATICGVLLGIQITNKIEIKYVSGKITYQRPYILSILFLGLFAVREIAYLIISQPWIFSYIAIAIFISLGLIVGEMVTIFKKGRVNGSKQPEIS